MFFRRAMNPKKTVDEIFYPESRPPWYNSCHHHFEIVNDVTGQVANLGLIMKAYISDAQNLWTLGQYDDIQYVAYLACICNHFTRKCESVMQDYGPDGLSSRYLKLKNSVNYHYDNTPRGMQDAAVSRTTEELGEIQDPKSSQKHIPGVA